MRNSMNICIRGKFGKRNKLPHREWSGRSSGRQLKHFVQLLRIKWVSTEIQGWIFFCRTPKHLQRREDWCLKRSFHPYAPYVRKKRKVLRNTRNVRNTTTYTHVTNPSDAIGHFLRCLRQIRTCSFFLLRGVFWTLRCAHKAGNRTLNPSSALAAKTPLLHFNKILSIHSTAELWTLNGGHDGREHSISIARVISR